MKYILIKKLCNKNSCMMANLQNIIFLKYGFSNLCFLKLIFCFVMWVRLNDYFVCVCVMICHVFRNSQNKIVLTCSFVFLHMSECWWLRYCMYVCVSRFWSSDRIKIYIIMEKKNIVSKKKYISNKIFLINNKNPIYNFCKNRFVILILFLCYILYILTFLYF